MRTVLLHHEWWWLVVMMFIVFVAGLFQSAAGFGFALFAVPVGALVAVPRDVIVVVFLTASFVSLVLSRTQREHIVWPEAKRLSIGAVLGMPVGVWLLQHGSAAGLRLGLGICTTFAALWSLAMARRLTKPWIDSNLLGGIVGALSGVLNTALATNGPPLVIYLQGRRVTAEQFRATISFVFSVSNGVGLVMLVAAGAVRAVDLHLAGVMIIAAMLGTIIGQRISKRIPSGHFATLVNTLLLAGGLTALIRSLS